MRRKGLIGEETSSDSFINSLEYSFTDGDNQMKTSRLKQLSREADNFKIYNHADGEVTR